MQDYNEEVLKVIVLVKNTEILSSVVIVPFSFLKRITALLVDEKRRTAA